MAHLITADALDCLAGLIGDVRFKIYDGGYTFAPDAVRDALGHSDFESGWAEGAAMSTLGAIAYAGRGHGGRKRPASGWGALTPAERDVVRLVSEGLANYDIATRLFVSPRTVQSHLTHVYNKLGVRSRVQLAHEAARHTAKISFPTARRSPQIAAARRYTLGRPVPWTASATASASGSISP
jgi:DNA-binding CsgD family transcriptional regulator